MDNPYRALGILYAFAHMMPPFIVASYMALEQPEDEEQGVGIILFCMAAFLFFICTTGSFGMVTFQNTPTLYVVKSICGIWFAFSVTYSYFVCGPDSYPPPGHLKRMLKYRISFIYGIIGTVITYGWWGRGLWEVALWVFMMTTIVLSACIASKQIKFLTRLIKQVPDERNTKKRAKKVKAIKRCIMRIGIAVISLAAMVSFGLVRAYILFVLK